MAPIRVQTPGTSYDVIVERGCLRCAGEYIAPLTGERKLFAIADEAVWQALGPALEEGLAGLPATFLPIALGEQRKRLEVIEELAGRLHASGADRSSAVVAFGGGVTGDVAGFLAACYMRGIDVIQAPTTLLAQVDAAIGGKTGVNLASGKNLIGAFHQPRLVLIDPAALDTLPEREYRAGLFEVIKYGVIDDPELFHLMEGRREQVLAKDPATLDRIIAGSAAIKARVVSADEREGGLRRILNYGHTLGHALEAESGYSLLLHGEAVAYGMVAAGRLARLLGMLSESEAARMEALIHAYGPIPSLQGIEAERLAGRVAGDKKTIGGKSHFVLAEGIGAVRVVANPNRALVLEAARYGLEQFSGARAATAPPAGEQAVPS